MAKTTDLISGNNKDVYRTLIEESPTPIALYVGKDMVIKVANKTILEIWGKGDDVIDKSFHSILPELEGQAIFKLLDDVFTTGITYEASEYPIYLKRNGELEKFYFNFTFKALKNNDGNVWGIINTASDVTELVSTKQQLAAFNDEKNKLLTLIDYSSDFISLSEIDGTVSYINASGQDMLGMENEKIQRPNTDYIMPGEVEKLRNTINASLNSTGKWSGEINYRHFKTEEAIPVFTTTMVVYDTATGQPQGRATISRDLRREIADKKALVGKNDELNDQLRQFEFVTNFMPVQLWTAKTNGELDFVNKRALDFFDSTNEQIVGAEWLRHVHPDDREGCINTWTRSLQTGELYQYEFRLKDKHGVYKWHLARALPFVDDGQVVKWFGTNTDIDDQKQLQRQKDDFLGIASHELKTPVTSIKAYAQVLGAILTKEGEHKKAEMVNRMDAQVNRLTNLIGDLLDVTKINSGRLQFNKSWFDFNQAIQETVEDLQHTTQKHTLIMNFTPTGKIYADKDRMGQVITNLITNAIKYSPHAEQIIIDTKLENNEVIVCVQDFGIGIPGDKAEKVFEQFYRVSGSKQHTFPGLGLGLYISSEIIKREGGKIWVNSVEGKGSTFCFSLPVESKESSN